MKQNSFYIFLMRSVKFLFLVLMNFLSDSSDEEKENLKDILFTPDGKDTFEIPKSPYICFRCGRPLSDDFGFCTDCRSRPVFFALTYARHITAYGKKQRQFINQCKFKGTRILAISAAEKMFRAYKDNFSDLAVVPVPPRKERLISAGFDCVNDMAFILKWCFRLKVLTPLIRIDSEEQKYKSFAGRTNKSRKRYALKKNSKIRQQTVVLIDDIMTTGGTLEECAALLKSAGVKEVYALTLFYA